jgi:hypothetical protein
MPEYTHTLIPDRVDFVPETRQVSAFLDDLASIGAAPLKPEITVAKLSREVRSYVNPFTRKTESFPMRKAVKVKDAFGLSKALKGLDDYNVTVSGKGPPKVPAFAFDFTGKYDFMVRCCLRPEVVSTSDWHDEVPIKRTVQFFGQPCSATDRLGVFHNPNTLELVEVPNAGCARFWLEFEFGNMLFPAIEGSLDLIEPSIVQSAETRFRVKFIQGCHWCV